MKSDFDKSPLKANSYKVWFNTAVFEAMINCESRLTEMIWNKAKFYINDRRLHLPGLYFAVS